MYLEEKIIMSSLMFIFAIAVWFTSHIKGSKGLGSFSNPSWTILISSLFNEDGTEKKYSKLIVSIFFVLWGISFWIFPDFWSNRK
jgi:hypothetical protein